jgi:hypothetical protein
MVDALILGKGMRYKHESNTEYMMEAFPNRCHQDQSSAGSQSQLEMLGSSYHVLQSTHYWYQILVRSMVVAVTALRMDNTTNCNNALCLQAKQIFSVLKYVPSRHVAPRSIESLRRYGYLCQNAQNSRNAVLCR